MKLGEMEVDQAADVLPKLFARGIEIHEDELIAQAERKAAEKAEALAEGEKMAAAIGQARPVLWTKRAIFTGALGGAAVTVGGLGLLGYVHSSTPAMAYSEE